jgi:hypothetical protein
MPVDMSPSAVTGRLIRLAKVSPLTLPHRASLDMSPTAVEQRLREIGQLHAFYTDLQRARGVVAAPPPQPSAS